MLSRHPIAHGAKSRQKYRADLWGSANLAQNCLSKDRELLRVQGLELLNRKQLGQSTHVVSSSRVAPMCQSRGTSRIGVREFLVHRNANCRNRIFWLRRHLFKHRLEVLDQLIDGRGFEEMRLVQLLPRYPLRLAYIKITSDVVIVTRGISMLGLASSKASARSRTRHRTQCSILQLNDDWR